MFTGHASRRGGYVDDAFDARGTHAIALRPTGTLLCFSPFRGIANGGSSKKEFHAVLQPGTFDGTGSWREFLRRFEDWRGHIGITARSYGTTVSQLRHSLVGD